MTEVSSIPATKQTTLSVINILDTNGLAIRIEHHRAKLYVLREFVSERLSPDTDDLKMLMLFVDDICESNDRFLKKLYRSLERMEVAAAPQ